MTQLAGVDSRSNAFFSGLPTSPGFRHPHLGRDSLASHLALDPQPTEYPGPTKRHPLLGPGLRWIYLAPGAMDSLAISMSPSAMTGLTTLLPPFHRQHIRAQLPRTGERNGVFFWRLDWMAALGPQPLDPQPLDISQALELPVPRKLWVRTAKPVSAGFFC